MLPAQWRDVACDFVGCADVRQRHFEIASVPQDDGGDEQVEAGGAIGLVLGLSALLGHGYTVDNRAQPEMATFGVFRRRVPPIAMQNRRLPLDHWGQVVVRSDFR